MEAVAQEKDREVTVRRLAAGEESQFLRLADGYYHAMNALGVPGMKNPLSAFLEGFSRFLLKRMDEPQSGVFVALEGDEFIGGIIGTQNEATAWQDPEVFGVIEWVYVAEGLRRKNIGSLLVDALETVFRAAGLTKNVGYIWQGNVASQQACLQRRGRYDFVSIVREI
jgi:GNAT superfamily N-acetyltransferase